MFEKFKFWLKKEEPQEKHIIICIHGFGVRRVHEYDNFKQWSIGKYHLHTFDIFVIESEEDYRPEVWIRRCESVVESFLNAGYKVDVVGFSMGGVLASHVASKYDVGRLFLISPAFDYINISNIIWKAKEFIYPKSKIESNEPTMPTKYTQCFTEVIRLCKDSISKIECPICIVHGDKDEVIPLKSSTHAFDKITHDKKRLFIIHNGNHHLMTHRSTGNEIYQLFILFIDKIILPDEAINFAKDIYKEN